MKRITTFSALLGLAASACAPVATSVPKIPLSTPRTSDSVTVGSGKKFDLAAVSAEVVSADLYDQFEKSIPSDYRATSRDASEAKTGEWIETRGSKKIEIASTIDRADLKIIFVVNADQKAIDREMGVNSKLNAQGVRQDARNISVWISEKSDGDRSWAFVKKNLKFVSIFYRESKNLK